MELLGRSDGASFAMTVEPGYSQTVLVDEVLGNAKIRKVPSWLEERSYRSRSPLAMLKRWETRRWLALRGKRRL